MGKFKLRPMSEAPRDGRFICVVYRDGSGALPVYWDGGMWLSIDYDEQKIPEFSDEESSGLMWFWPQRRWLETLLNTVIVRHQKVLERLPL